MRLGADAGLFVGAAQRLFLAGGVRFVDRRAAAVAGGADAADDGIDAVAVALGVGQALQNDDAQPLAQGGAVAVGIEGAGVAARREGRRFAEAGVHEDVVKGIDAAGDDHVGFARRQLQGGQVDGGEGAAAGGVADAVGAAEIEVTADAAGDDVAEETGKGIFLPGDIGIGDPLHGIGGDGIVDAGVLQRRPPARMAEAGAEGDDQLQGAGDAENDADALAVEILFRAVAGILQGLIDRHQPEELGGVGRLQGVGQNAVFERIEVDGGKKAAVPARRPCPAT